MLAEKSSESVKHGKKKRSFLQKQKRFAKHGSFGRGTQLSPDMYEYFLDIMRVMNSKKEDAEEMSVLASNILHELEGKESEYCCNNIVSRIVETLLPFSTDEEFSNFTEKFSENLRVLFCDTYASHVLQQTLIVSLNKYQKCLSEETESKHSVKFFNYILKISKFLFNNLEDFIWDVYSNAVGRTVFNVLSGNPVKGEVKQSDPTEVGCKGGDEGNLPSEFTSLVRQFAKRILSWPQFNDLCNNPVNSNFLQSLLVACKKCEESSEMVERIISFYESSPIDLREECNAPFVRLIEEILSMKDKKIVSRIYKLIFKGNLVELATSKTANFAVQKLILNCSKEKTFGKIFAKLGSHTEEILKVGHSGVLLALVKGCRNLEILQGECLTMLMTTFHANDTKDIVPLVGSLTTSENFDPETSPLTLHGSLIIQELLHFKKPIKIVNSLLELTTSQLLKILTDARGSHVTDTFVSSSSIGEKSRTRLFKKLQGHYLGLATSKFGSRSLDAIWSVISVPQKALLAEELKSKQSELVACPFGRGFARKIHLDNFRRDKKEWIKLQTTSETVDKYFSDIVPKKRQKTS